MKIACALAFIIVAQISVAQKVASDIKLTEFKKIPEEMMGCGNCYYLTQVDKKNGCFIGIDDYSTMLIYINEEPHKFILGSNGKDGIDVKKTGYSLNFKKTFQKQKGDEYYIFKGLITLKYRDKIVYRQSLIGDGGC